MLAGQSPVSRLEKNREHGPRVSRFVLAKGWRGRYVPCGVSVGDALDKDGGNPRESVGIERVPGGWDCDNQGSLHQQMWQELLKYRCGNVRQHLFETPISVCPCESLCPQISFNHLGQDPNSYLLPGGADRDQQRLVTPRHDHPPQLQD